MTGVRFWVPGSNGGRMDVDLPAPWKPDAENFRTWRSYSRKPNPISGNRTPSHLPDLTIPETGRWLKVLRLGLLCSAFGWGISFWFTFVPWQDAADQLRAMGAKPLRYDPLSPAGSQGHLAD